jgi:hypothetical protein
MNCNSWGVLQETYTVPTLQVPECTVRLTFLLSNMYSFLLRQRKNKVICHLLSAIMSSCLYKCGVYTVYRD